MVMRSGRTPAYWDVRLVSGMPSVQAEQAGRPGAVLDGHRDIAHELAEFLGQPVQRGGRPFPRNGRDQPRSLAHYPA